jgi:endonuclease YncB( thermonuclease family)
MRRIPFVLTGALLALASHGPSRGVLAQKPDEKPTVVKETLKGGIAHSPENYVRITGKPKVIDGNTIAFDDGVEIDISAGMDAPALEQLGLLDGKFYPAGKESAEFLRKLIGDQAATCFASATDKPGPNRRLQGICYVGAVRVDHEMILGGWAVADHSLAVPTEIIARENKRGLWRGQFVAPKRWRKGERLPGEQGPKGVEKKPTDNPAAVLGDWDSIDRHVAMASLFQPEHGVRKREAVVHFEKTGDRLTGYAVAEDFPDRKNGRTDFRTVTFADGRLTFEFDVSFSKQHGPLIVEAGRVENKGSVRVEARLKEGRLVGTWRMYHADGAEVFRGEWEATRAKAAEKK